MKDILGEYLDTHLSAHANTRHHEKTNSCVIQIAFTHLKNKKNKSVIYLEKPPKQVTLLVLVARMTGSGNEF